MNFAEIVLIAFGVSVDAAAVSVSGSLCPGKYSKRHCALNAALFFGGFQFIMPVAGFFAASIFSETVTEIDHFLAFALLTIVGGKMIYEAYSDNGNRDRCPLGDFFSAKNLILPAIATSLDALAIGAGLAFNGTGIWFPAAAMGGITAIVSAFCVLVGKKLASSSVSEKKMTAVGGSVIILIGIKILLQDLGIL